jgi:hypothetical protein
MFDLENSIADWRKHMLTAGIKTPVPLEELESHLREEIEQQMKSGLNEQKAFEIATGKIGQASPLKKEFKKVNEADKAQQRKRAGIIFAGSLGLYSLIFTRLLIKSDLTSNERLLGFASVATTLFLVYVVWQIAPRFFPFIANKAVQSALGLLGGISGMGWFFVYVYFILPRCDRASKNFFNSSAALPPKPGTLANLFQRRRPQSLHRAEFFQQRRFAPLADAGKFVQHALGNFLEPQLRVVGIRHAMTFVADALQQFHRRMIEAEPQRFAFARQINFLKFLRQPDDGNFFEAEFFKFGTAMPNCPLPPSIKIKSGKFVIWDGRRVAVPECEFWDADTASLPKLFFTAIPRRTFRLVSFTSVCNSCGHGMAVVVIFCFLGRRYAFVQQS